MRPIHIGRTDKSRPVLVLTRELARPLLHWVTVAPITSTIRGISTEVRVGPANGLDHDCVVSCDNISTIRATDLGREVGYLLREQEAELNAAIAAAFDLEL
ncbi:type II toxin-antitoxin system PemK/MazF family toxin [Luteipulveratus mongoliensis]|uniref:mRNA interferase MazF3 n=1 Tax=Luteipulveratus mongoliensis TaxID=571913 RepID=A0A0K1JMU4_9MICO|nr:type II toxin-antitoxin system PemK/MazF family toxin [Luteipulveratus mongoliensis]AKU17903.1 mRNA interferase MazF3 [Luteipulveratus mongoliensis]